MQYEKEGTIKDASLRRRAKWNDDDGKSNETLIIATSTDNWLNFVASRQSEMGENWGKTIYKWHVPKI